MLFIIIVGTLSSLCLVKAARRRPGPLRSGRGGQNGRRVVCSVVTEDFRAELARVLVAVRHLATITVATCHCVKAVRLRWPGPLRSGRGGQSGRRVVCSVVTEDFRPELAPVLVAAALRGVSATTVSGPHATRRRARVSQTVCQRRRLRPVHPASNHHSNFIHRH